MENTDGTNNHEGDSAPENHDSEEAPIVEALDEAFNNGNGESQEEDKDEVKEEDENDEEVKKEEADEENDKDAEVKSEEKPKGKMKIVTRDGKPADLDICRVCKTKDDLGSIFEFDEALRICDLITSVCTVARILERDHLPHKICKGCVDNLKIAVAFKTQCEATDKELRQTLKRSYNKARRNTDFIIVNCPMSDGEEDDDEQQDDDEYKVSHSEVESEPVTSDDSFAPIKKPKKQKTPKRRGRRPKSESVSADTTPVVKRKRGRQPGFRPQKKTPAPEPSLDGTPTPRRRGRPPKSSVSPGIANVVYIEAPDASSSSDSDDDKPIRPRKKQHDCPKCDDSFSTGVELKEHLVTHKGDLFPCTKCDKSFKSKAYLANHLQRHEQDDKRREDKIKAKEAKRQMQRQKELQKRKDHEEKIKRQRTEGGSAEKKKKLDPNPANSGRDLFKCVAPLTSTYWSDSFSD
ncbi:zinc finger protein CG2199 isoform X2 [Uranotaenia lowii]|nr:zinc finger protein CG2199 isoform X2 [Uranotaenia lowii]XP_055601979.1 zinc finger protein CG2199 isoform X2 [Uranotaenia lowii]